MRNRALLPILISMLLGASAARTASAQQLYAQSNLQLQKGKLIPVNYRTGSMIPVGTGVKVLDQGKSAYKCVTSDGVEFTFVPHKQIRQPIDKTFSLFVSKEDPRPRIEKLSASDQALVKKGALERGMSKEAVLLSIGPPPSHKTASLESSTWMYWKSKFDTFKVIFGDDNKVLSLPGWEEIAAPPPPPEAHDYRYALANVYVLEGKVSWVNYLKGTVIPVGTKIEVTDVDDDEIEFKNADSGEEYTFENEKDTSGMATGKLFDRLFSKQQGDVKLASLDQKEQKKVRGVEVQQGMTKSAVLMAIGPPPPHQTPSLDSSTWTYWKSRTAKMKVTFDDDDKVKAVE
jgi:outer membrane protein assembly factor BamE (lipoprotein component of BamABCDE complex)